MVKLAKIPHWRKPPPARPPARIFPPIVRWTPGGKTWKFSFPSCKESRNKQWKERKIERKKKSQILAWNHRCFLQLLKRSQSGKESRRKITESMWKQMKSASVSNETTLAAIAVPIFLFEKFHFSRLDFRLRICQSQLVDSAWSIHVLHTDNTWIWVFFFFSKLMFQLQDEEEEEEEEEKGCDRDTVTSQWRHDGPKPRPHFL